jgi:hypothetical protein
MIKKNVTITNENGINTINQFEINWNYLFGACFLFLVFSGISIVAIVNRHYVLFGMFVFLSLFPNQIKYAIFKNRIVITKDTIEYDYGIFPFYIRKKLNWRLVQFAEMYEKCIERGFRGVFSTQTFHILKLNYNGNKINLLTTTDIEECYRIQAKLNELRQA